LFRKNLADQAWRPHSNLLATGHTEEYEEVLKSSYKKYDTTNPVANAIRHPYEWQKRKS
jgi:hypothetical protein